MNLFALLSAMLAGLLSFVAAVAKILAFGWIVALRRLVRELWETFERWRARHELPGRARKASDAPCVPINHEALHRPDPLIYAQYDLMTRGYAVTWDNPDIEVHKGGVVVPSSHMAPGTEYEIVARVWNNSTDAPVVGLTVIFSYLSFGVGMKLHVIGATSVNLGVKGGPNHPAFATVKWKTPPTTGHYCLLAFLAPADDTNFGNNLGQENIVVGKVMSPATFTFQLRNQSNRDEKFRFDVDTYAIPPRRPCDSQRLPDANRATRVVGSTAPVVPATHDRRNYPAPPGWSVAIDPAEPQLPPDGEMTITVRITAPPSFTGRQSFNVNAFDRQGFAGGVTLYVEAS